MTSSSGPTWFYPGDLPRSVAATMDTEDATVDHLIDVLQSHEFDAPRERIRKVILTTQDQLEDRVEEEEFDPLDDPRSLPPRYVSVDDVAYLGRRSCARLLGIILSSYDGTYHAPSQEDDLALDLLWSRQHRTVGLRIETRREDTPVDEASVQDFVEGDTSPSTGRAPSALGVITNTTFTDDAQTLASNNDITLFDNAWLTERLQEIQLSWEIAGPVIEATADEEDNVEELVEDQDLLPSTYSEVDPFSDETRPHEIAIGETEKQTNPQPGSQAIPEDESTTDPGQRGVLYANPDDDGDYDAFDRFAESLGGDKQS